MRVSIKALAPLSSLVLLASCATTASPASYPSPGVRASRAAAPPASEPAAPSARMASYSRQQPGNYDKPVPPHLEGQYSRPKVGRMTFLFGRRELDDEFAPAEDPDVFGIEFNNVAPGSGVGYEFGFQFGYDEAKNELLPTLGVGDLEVAQGEIYAGLRAELSPGPVRPYVGFGGTWIHTETTIDLGPQRAKEDDDDFGLYAHTGIHVDLNESFFVGVDYRAIFGTEYTVDGTDFDGDYQQLTFVLGLSF